MSDADTALSFVHAEIERLGKEIERLEGERAIMRLLLEEPFGVDALYRIARGLVASQAVTSDDVIAEGVLKLIRARSRVRSAEVVEHFASEVGIPLSRARVDAVLDARASMFTKNSRGWWTVRSQGLRIENVCMEQPK